MRRILNVRNFLTWSLRRLVVASLLLAALIVPRASVAQTDPDPSDGAHSRYGPLAFTPAVVFSTGYDTNIYRTSTAFGDYETFAVPQIEAWWNLPGFRVQGIGAMEFVHFANNVGATNTQAGVRIDRVRARVMPFFSFNHRRTNANPTGFEIGYRSMRLENTLSAGAKARISPRAEMRFTGAFGQTRWDAAAIYQTSSLREKLNRNTSAADAAFVYRVTPLTAVGVDTGITRDRFIFSPERNGDSFRIAPVVEFAKPALVFGSVSVGVTRFRSRSSGAADFDGLTGRANIGYAAPDGTLVTWFMNRGPAYSWDTSLAYYLMTSNTINVSRRLARQWDTAAFGGFYSLDYRPAGTRASIGRVEHVVEFGAAVAYRLGRWTRVGTSVERASKDGSDSYRALRAVGFVTYGSGRFQRLDRPTPFDR